MLKKLNLFIASPLEKSNVEKIINFSKRKLNVIYKPDLLPPIRYIADHTGNEKFTHTKNQKLEWNKYVSNADILWDFPFFFKSTNSDLIIPRNVRWIQTTSSGIGQMVKKIKFQNPHINITTAKGIHAKPLAEFVFHSILSFYKKSNFLESQKKKKNWERYCGNGIEGKTIGVIGTGEIGRQVIKIAKAFDMKIFTINSPNDHEKKTKYIDKQFKQNQLKLMLKDIDVLVLCVPHTKHTENLISKKDFDVCKNEMILINISRGSVVDEKELIIALKNKKISFAALDVFKKEPLPKRSPLWNLKNVLISPHSASTISQENKKITEIFCYNLNHFLKEDYQKMINNFDFNKMY